MFSLKRQSKTSEVFSQAYDSEVQDPYINHSSLMEFCGFERTSRFETSRQSRQNRQRRKSTCHPKSMCMRKNYPEAMPMPPRCWLWSPRFTATWMRCRSLSRDCQQCGLWSSQDCWWILRSSQDCVKAFQAIRLSVLTCSLWCCQTEKLKKSLDSKEAREIQYFQFGL